MSDFFDKEDIIDDPAVESDGDFFDSADTIVDQPEEMSKTEALLRGGAQGLTFDFADEIAGALGAAGETVFGEAKIADLLDTYEQQRDESRALMAEAEETHPGTYLTGEIAGGILPAIGTGGAGAIASAGKVGLKQAAKQAAKAGAKFGAASALGRTAEIEDIGQVAKDVALGAGTGAALGAVMPSAEKGIRSLAKGGKGFVKKTAKFLGDSLSDLDAKDTERLLKDPTLLASAKDYGEIADELKNVANKQLKDFGEIAGRGRKALSENPDMNTSDILAVIDDKLGNISFADEEIRQPLAKLRGWIEKEYSTGLMSEKQVQEVMDELAEKAYKGVKKDTADVVKNSLRSIRGELSDKIKQKNPIYSEAMEQASEKREAIGKAADRFGLVEETKIQDLLDDLDSAPQFVKEFSFKNKDSAVSKLKNLGKEGKFTDKELFSDISTIMDIPDEVIRSAKANEMLAKIEKGKMFTTQDLTMAKALLGAAINPMLGAGMILARPAIKGLYKNLHKMPTSKANSIMKAVNSVAKKAGQTVAFPAGMAVAKNKQAQLDEMLKGYSENKDKALLAHEKQMKNMSQEELAEGAEEMKKQGFDSYSNAMERASKSDNERERAAQEMVLNQQAGFRSLMRRKDKEKKK